VTSRTPSSDSDTEASAFGHVRGHRRNGSGLPKYYTLKAVAEALDVSTRTVRRWIANGDLIAIRVDGVLRIGERDLGLFLALHRGD